MDESDLTTQLQPSAPAAKVPVALLPGAVLGRRYRVVAPLGHGGMGEVYRAEDLKLGQAVALKFLPPAFRGDEARRQRLRDEVKLARLVAHPNVCRVWDIVEADGHEFLSMEYVDGEDLASVLRRIGRLPEERAVRMARELCAGLSAVHDQGILHRDLKPANVMVDGRGRVRIADFGLAALAERLTSAEASAGTPAYMSPEQREGREVTVRSDIHALGLVLYEIFTGRPAFPPRAAEERGSHPTPKSPSSHVKELDPAIDRAIERCLATDSALRPASALAVAASLPGGDPLAAALAAGETPSPELVAAVGGVGGLRPLIALSGLAAAVGGVALVAFLGDRVSPFYLDLDKPPQVLVHEAQQILKDLGPGSASVDRAYDFVLEGEKDQRRPLFWYRESPQRLSREQQRAGGLSFTHPPHVVPGMAGVVLDAHGALVEYVRVPASGESQAATGPGWAAVLRRAGLDLGAARPVAPAGIPPVFGDERHAWDLGEPGAPTRVEAASFRGRPVWLRVQDPAAPADTSSAQPGSMFVYLILGVLLLATMLAWRNVRIGRADREGARRIAAFVALGWVVGISLYNPRNLEPPLVLQTAATVLLLAASAWVSYLALEPIVRRRWPETVVSWTRLLRGRVFDPLVGRDILLGVLGGVAATLVGQAGRLAQGAAAARWPDWPDGLARGWAAVADLIAVPAYAIGENLFVLLVLVLLRQLLRRAWAALAVTLALLVAPPYLGSPEDLLYHLVVRGVLYGLLVWPGLVAAVTAMSVRYYVGPSLMTTHLGAWYANEAIAGILATLAVAAWGFYASLGGRPLFGDPRREAV